MKECMHQIEAQFNESEILCEQKADEIHKMNEELNTYKQHCEHLQNQVHSLMEENERTLKVNTALLYKTKILEEDVRQKGISNVNSNQSIPEKVESHQEQNIDLLDEENSELKTENLDEVDQEPTPQEILKFQEIPDIVQEDLEGKEDSDHIEVLNSVEPKSEEKEIRKEASVELAPELEHAKSQPQNESQPSELSIQSMNDKKTINRLNNRIKELEILLEAEKGGVIIESKNKQIQEIEQKFANLEAKIEDKEKYIKELEQSLSDLQVKHESTFKEKIKLESICEEIKGSSETRIKELEESLNQTKASLEIREKLHDSYQKKITSLLDEKEEMLTQIENLEKKEKELSETIDHCQGKDNKKDKIYTRMLKNKDKAIQKMNMEIEKLQNAERSRAQTVEYFKKRVQVLEKETNNKE